jgi:hypothetical protein
LGGGQASAEPNALSKHQGGAAYECAVLHLLASIRLACWLMATAVAGGAVPFVILVWLGY